MDDYITQLEKSNNELVTNVSDLSDQNDKLTEENVINSVSYTHLVNTVSKLLTIVKTEIPSGTNYHVDDIIVEIEDQIK